MRTNACLLLMAVALQASSVPRLSLRELVDKTDLAAEVIIESVRFERNENGVPFSVYTATNKQPLVGTAPRTIEIWQPGGVDPDTGIAVMVPGTPQFAPGQRMILFLYRSRSGKLHVLANEQGVRAAHSAAERQALATEIRGLRK